MAHARTHVCEVRRFDWATTLDPHLVRCFLSHIHCDAKWFYVLCLWWAFVMVEIERTVSTWMRRDRMIARLVPCDVGKCYKWSVFGRLVNMCGTLHICNLSFVGPFAKYFSLSTSFDETASPLQSQTSIFKLELLLLFLLSISLISVSPIFSLLFWRRNRASLGLWITSAWPALWIRIDGWNAIGSVRIRFSGFFSNSSIEYGFRFFAVFVVVGDVATDSCTREGRSIARGGDSGDEVGENFPSLTSNESLSLFASEQ